MKPGSDYNSIRSESVGPVREENKIFIKSRVPGTRLFYPVSVSTAYDLRFVYKPCETAKQHLDESCASHVEPAALGAVPGIGAAAVLASQAVLTVDAVAEPGMPPHPACPHQVLLAVDNGLILGEVCLEYDRTLGAQEAKRLAYVLGGLP